MKVTASKRILALMIIVSLIAASIAVTLYNKQHTDLSTSEADIEIDAMALFSAFEADETKATAQYVDKLIKVSGTAQEITETEGGGMLVVLRDEMEMFGVNCSFLPTEQSAIQSLQIGDKLTIKGLCSGATIGGVDLSRCIISQ